MRDKYIDQDLNEIPVINLADAPGERQSWGRPAPVVFLWALFEIAFVTNPLQISSNLRVRILRLFGAKIGENVVFRPRTRVKFPWNLEIGDRSWVGEGVWIHNQDRVVIGSDAVVSQDAFLTTGSHRVRTDMGLITSPVSIEDGAWICTRAVVLGGCTIGRSAVLTPNSVLSANRVVPDGEIWGNPQASYISNRY